MSKRLMLAVCLASLTAGCGASPQAVCAHMKEVVSKESGDAAATAAMEGCEKKWERSKEIKGLINYKEKADCVMDATTMQQISEC